MTRDWNSPSIHDPRATFELLADLCGALWKGAIVAAQVLVALAIIGDWSGWPALYAAVAAAVAKWLEYEFRASGRRAVAWIRLDRRASMDATAWASPRSTSLASIDGTSAVAPLVKPLQP